MNRENRILKFSIITIVICIFTIIVVCIFTSNEKLDNHTTFECNVKILSLSTKIIINTNGDKIGTIQGNLFRYVEDPLTMTDANGNKIAYAGDDYHLIAQDSHVIIADGVVKAEMVGNFDLLGNSYNIYDSKGNKIATAEFNFLNTYGTLRDKSNKLLATYKSNIFFSDYDVDIAKDCPIDNTTVLMIFASYYSDQSYDNSAEYN